ncbi:DUF1488 domain-containing protein [Rhizobium cremeum]|uniref:DUF1488 domain-containing protein n=1 Tax=Rhizobium cremeum TaxID=2813827 RepID=UPI001FD2095B|nr:DUF1488 domain-containing protein [Rhizobium cremeum]MCJ7997960.1 DUF1488 domain-containing protein [Rhizobium cremeum]MCJ8003054.1 DUF1488 domain-containing protein [Rhizobium cremeum]
MSLSFANRTRTYDERRSVIRFVGHDGLKQIVFLLSVGLFDQDSSALRLREQGYLMAFDQCRSRILEIARALYQKNNRSMIEMDTNAVGSSLRFAN